MSQLRDRWRIDHPSGRRDPGATLEQRRADHVEGRVLQAAALRRNLVTRGEVVSCGGTDAFIHHRLSRGLWQQLFPGVYLIGAASPDWQQRLTAAVLAAGEGAAASHRAAIQVWGFDGVRQAPLEISVEHDHQPVLPQVIVYRSRRPIEWVNRAGVAVTDPRRTIMDAAAVLPRVAVAKAFESACRAGLLTPGGMVRYIEDHGGRGVKGTAMLRGYLEQRSPGRPAGSGAEVEVLEALSDMGIEPPERQVRIPLADGAVAVVDLGWLHRRKLVEVDGFAAHSSPADLEASNERQNALLEAGYELRRYAGTTVRRHPLRVATSIYRFLNAPSPFLGA